jgi:hypothetical protein
MDQQAIKAQQEQAAAMQAQQELEQMKAQVAAMQAAQTQATVTPTVSPASAAQTDLLAQLAQLGQLKEAGVLTEEEFQLAKTKILN